MQTSHSVPPQGGAHVCSTQLSDAPQVQVPPHPLGIPQRPISQVGWHGPGVTVGFGRLGPEYPRRAASTSFVRAANAAATAPPTRPDNIRRRLMPDASSRVIRSKSRSSMVPVLSRASQSPAGNEIHTIIALCEADCDSWSVPLCSREGNYRGLPLPNWWILGRWTGFDQREVPPLRSGRRGGHGCALEEVGHLDFLDVRSCFGGQFA